jgi:molybdate transport system substrate-binding protein
VRGLLPLTGVCLVAVVVMLLAGCGAQTSDGQGVVTDTTTGGEGDKQGGTLQVFAAASLTDAFKELATKFEERHPGVEVRTNFAGSSTVLAQIQQGAPADVFASADKEKMDTAVGEGLVAGSPQTFVKNAEVVTIPNDNPASIKQFRDLAQSDVDLVLAQENVPVADYAVDILENATPTLGDNFKEDVLEELVSREADTRAAINRVALGEADATFSYSSDVTPDVREKVKSVEIPEKFNVIPTYPIAVTKRSDNPDLARKWVEFVLSDGGQKVLKKWGFQQVSH